jgi:hypothetical protein
MTYFRAFRHYHRPWQLNGRVRNGNACDLPSVVTGNRSAGRQAGRTRMYALVIAGVVNSSQERMPAADAIREQKWSSVCPLVPVG